MTRNDSQMVLSRLNLASTVFHRKQSTAIEKKHCLERRGFPRTVVPIAGRHPRRSPKLRVLDAAQAAHGKTGRIMGPHPVEPV